MIDLALPRVAPIPPIPATEAGMQALTFELRPHRSLTDAGARRCLASVAAVSLGAATLIALRGAWPVFLYSGLVILCTWAAFRASMKARNDLHEIRITQHEVQLRFTQASRTSRVSLERYWTRVRLQPSSSTNYPSQLLVESAGRSYEIGSFLTEPERRDLDARLRPLIGRMGELPSLDESPS